MYVAPELHTPLPGQLHDRVLPSGHVTFAEHAANTGIANATIIDAVAKSNPTAERLYLNLPLKSIIFLLKIDQRWMGISIDRVGLCFEETYLIRKLVSGQ